MSDTLDRIRKAGQPYGLNLVAGIPIARYDAMVTEPYRAAAIDGGARSIVVIANGGGALWQALQLHARQKPGWFTRDHPLDDFTREVVENQIVPAVQSAGLSSTTIYPFMSSGRTLNFIELGKIAGLAGPSILGVVVHPRFGPWMAFRAALLVDEDIDLPGEAIGFDPCPTCESRSCVPACPTGAVAFPAGWDIPRCLNYRIESEADCAPRCHSRVACVLGPEHRYPDDEVAYHQRRALAAMRPWYEKNLVAKTQRH